jgi:exosortase A
MSVAVAAPAEAGASPWRLPLLLMAAGTLVWFLLFREEAAEAVRIWSTSAAYNHGFAVLPIALWLGWQRRHRLAHLSPRPAPLLALLAVPAALAWLAAERLGIMEGRQLAALGLLLALVPAVLGWRFARAFAVPLAFLVFLVPFGEFTVPWLQDITARMVDWGLDLTSIPHFTDGLIIEIPEGQFHIAEACAGLRFIIAALAFGAVYAAVMFRSPWRRLVVMVLALAVPVVANGVRAWGLVVLGHYQGSAAAVEADHLLYGWVFFSLVLLLLILAGLPFRQDDRAPPVLDDDRQAPRRPRLAAAALALAVAPAFLAAGAAAAMDAAVPPAREVAVALPALPGCEAEGEALRCPGGTLSARLILFAPNTNWDRVLDARRRATSAMADEDVTFDVAAEGATWRARVPREGGAAAAAASWLEGRQAGGGLRPRLAQATRRAGGEGGPVVAVVELREGEGGRERTLLREVLEAAGPALARRAAEASLKR